MLQATALKLPCFLGFIVLSHLVLNGTNFNSFLSQQNSITVFDLYGSPVVSSIKLSSKSVSYVFISFCIFVSPHNFSMSNNTVCV